MSATLFIILALILFWIYRTIKLNTLSVDPRGYLRDGFGRLVHRRVAFKYLYNIRTHPNRFGTYDVHHIDRNKLNNAVNNLQILTREQHIAIHGH